MQSMPSMVVRTLADAPPVLHEAPAVANGSRRRRVWQLADHAHCPVVGVCLPMPALRRLLSKVVGGLVLADDYELHCGVVADCKQRTRTADAVQRELDQRHVGALRQAQRHKTTEALAQWWRDACDGGDIAGPLWAVLTHPRCDLTLEARVLRDVHMLQHQAGAACRADLQKLQALSHENGVLARELGQVQQRATRMAREQAQRIDELQSQLMRLRADLMGRDTTIGQLRDEVAELSTQHPGLRERIALQDENQRLLDRLRDAQRQLLREQQVNARTVSVPPPAQAPAEPAAVPQAQQALHSQPAGLTDRAVLCVGGRPASVPAYRRLIEHTGGRFLHHDGGAEDHVSTLDATLAAADLVICQTGCVSHDAYWRVKDHCKRTGKPCVFVETPSRAGLKRALLRLVPVAPD